MALFATTPWVAVWTVKRMLAYQMANGFVVGMSACHFSALSMAAGTMWTTGSVPVHGEASLRFKRVWRVE